MPSTICDSCRQLMDHSYKFKQICKKADTLLKTYPLTGVWPEKLQLPVNLFKNAQTSLQMHSTKSVSRAQTTVTNSKNSEGKIMRKTVTVLPPSPVEQLTTTASSKEQHVSPSRDQEDVKPRIVKLSIEDLRNIKQGALVKKTNLIQKKSSPVKNKTVEVIQSQLLVPAYSSSKKSPMKKSAGQLPKSIMNSNLNDPKPVLLNSLKPTKVTEEHFVQTAEGRLEIISMEAPESVQMEASDPMKNAPLVKTNVFPCSECERSFPLRQLLDIHMKNHNRERNHPCELCDKRFFSKYDLAKHNLTHTGLRPYVCIICNAAFSRSTLLTRHQKVHKDQPKFVCMYCERTFLSNDELQKHVVNHQKMRPFQCQKCPKSFAYKQGLERHEVVHSSNLPFPCEHCDLSFASAGKLARHLTAHAGSRPYPCRLCSRSFMLSHHLTRHLRGHQGGQGSYKCVECAEIFCGQDDLIYHSAVHATQSLTCPLCREQFETVRMVTDHIKLHSEGLQYACDYCDLLFHTEERLDNHCQQEHLSVLAMDRTVSDSTSFEESVEPRSEFITIEEINIRTDGSKVITTFVDGEERNKMIVGSQPLPHTLKTEFTAEDAEIRDEISEDAFEESQTEGGCFYENDGIGESTNEKSSEMPTRSESTKILPSEKSPLSPKILNVKTATQSKLDTFFKKSSPITKKDTDDSVGAALKKLPKGVVVKTTMSKPNTTGQLPGKPTMSTTTSSNASITESLRVKSTPSKKETKESPKLPQKTTTIKKEPVQSPPKSATKRPHSPDSSPKTPQPPTKKSAIESTKSVVPVATKSTPIKSTSKSDASHSVVKKGGTFEMKIGNKMVKVQKVVMTKAEVAAMTRDGKIEMQGNTMILKQPKVKK
ncbi:zinc finger protein 37-like isoform X2 [Uranotaenia lowii]|nr:zinc finger protein 37-like isoform X2 [Uranotaenia lowii]